MTQIKMTHGKARLLTCAQKPSIALLHWFWSRCKYKLPENPEMFKVYVFPRKFPTKGQPFLDIVIAACEREFNKTPPLIWKDYAGTYEDYCMWLLKWLHEHGDIVTLEIDDNYIPDV